MKGQISMKLSIYTTIGISVFSTLASAQDLNNPSYGPNLQQRMMMDRQEQNYQSTENMQIQRQRQQAWQAKENAIQAQIERYRATPYYGSLAVNSLEAGVYWGGGGNTNRKISEEKAIAICAQNSCKILKTIYNTCAAVSWPANAPQKIIVSTNHDPQLAIQEAGQSCEKKYGEENCRISLNKKTNSYAYCSGYDYGTYRQK